MIVKANHYEEAFMNWLSDNRIRYLPVDQHKRRVFSRFKVKSFDFLVYPPGGGAVMAEVKGRKYKGTSLAGLSGLECWVTMDDVRGLIRWNQVLNAGMQGAGDKGHPYEAAFLFVYEFANVDVEADGAEVYDCGDKNFVIFAVRLDDYRESMVVRSPKWQTVTLPAAKFREVAVGIREFLVDGR